MDTGKQKQNKRRVPTLLFIVMLSFVWTWSGYAPATAAAAAATPSFKDVPSTHWAHTSITEGVQKGYLDGFPDGTFRPNDPVTVAQFLKMVLLAMTEKDASGRVDWAADKLALVPDWHLQYFEDEEVSFEPGGKGEAWYVNYANTAKAVGMIFDNFENRYNEHLTREKAAEILVQLDSYLFGAIQDAYALKAGPVLLKDYTKIGHYYKLSTAKMALRGIMVGDGGNFNPSQYITRAEASKITNVMANPKLRNPQKIDLSIIPHATVNAPGYGDATFVFANWEMQRTFQLLQNEAKIYGGVSESIYALTGFYANQETAQKHFNKMYYFAENIFDTSIDYDILFSFNGNAYSININSDTSHLTRSSIILDKFLSQIFKEPLVARKLIDDNLGLEQRGGLAKENKTIEGRQIVIGGTGRGFISIGISAYADK